MNTMVSPTTQNATASYFVVTKVIGKASVYKNELREDSEMLPAPYSV